MDEGPFGCFLFALCALIMWLVWPISLWFTGAVFCAVLLHSLVKPNADSSSAGARLWHAALPSMRDSAIGISIGLGIVTLAQAVFNVADTSSATVKRWEEIVATMQHKLAAVMRPSVVLTILVALLLISVAWPQFHLMKRFTSVKKWGGRVLLVLTTITAFTFFSSLAVSRSEPHWVAAREQEAREAVATIEEGRRELLALAWLQEKADGFPPPLRKELADFFATAPETGDPEAAEERAAEWFASSAPVMPGPDGDKPSDMFERVANWLARKSPAPVLEDVAGVCAESRKVKEMLPQARIVAEEALKAAIGSFIPKSIDPLLKPFIKALTGALVKNALANYPIRDITDYNSAVALVKEQRNSPNGKPRTMLQMWRWGFPPFQKEVIPRDADANGPSYVTGREFAKLLGNPPIEIPSSSSYPNLGGPTLGRFGSLPPSFGNPTYVPITPPYYYRGPVTPYRGVVIR